MNTDATIEHFKQISMPPGDGCISLPETPTSGYRWNLESTSGGVSMIGDDFSVSQNDSGAKRKLGGGGVRTFHVHVDAAGVYDLRFVRKRAWEDSFIEERTVRLKVA
jgi:predicted secreted protein